MNYINAKIVARFYENEIAVHSTESLSTHCLQQLCCPDYYDKLFFVYKDLCKPILT